MNKELRSSVKDAPALVVCADGFELPLALCLSLPDFLRRRMNIWNRASTLAFTL